MGMSACLRRCVVLMELLRPSGATGCRTEELWAAMLVMLTSGEEEEEEEQFNRLFSK